MAGIYRAGDRVRPTRGGPVMEIKGHDRHGKAICSWYETRHGWQQRSFAEETLRRVRRGRAPAG